MSRSLVGGLFASSVLLSIVSFYTTQQGMALYLSPWFSFLASLGVQSALLLVAWLVGVTESRRGVLVAVYAATAAVSIAFSYVSLHTWFASRERPAAIERALYDELLASAGKARELVTAAVAEGQRHVLALEEMTAAERDHGHVSRATDSDPYLAAVREAVAREAASYGGSYPEGQGPGLRYTAFERHAALARQTVDRLEESQRALARFVSRLRPLDPTEQQLREYRQVFDAVAWSDVREALHEPVEPPPVPAYADFVDRTASGQEDLVVAFTGLLAAPTSRHVLALSLAAFIDLVVFLLAWASGPFFFGAPEERWIRAGAALDGVDHRVFARDLLRKLSASPEGLARVEDGALTPGERQLVLLLAARDLAVPVREEGRLACLLAPAVHRALAESLADRPLPLRAAATEPATP